MHIYICGADNIIIFWLSGSAAYDCILKIEKYFLLKIYNENVSSIILYFVGCKYVMRRYLFNFWTITSDNIYVNAFVKWIKKMVSPIWTWKWWKDSAVKAQVLKYYKRSYGYRRGDWKVGYKNIICRQMYVSRRGT